MKLFEVQNNSPTITTEALLIPAFKKIWDRDTTKDKGRAHRELSYIYFTADYKSLYLSYDKEVREERLRDEFIGKKDWTPDNDILVAIEKYKELQRTPSMAFLEDARKAVDSVRLYFNNIDWTERDDTNKPVYKIKEVTSALKDCEGIISTLDKLIEKVSKEQQIGGRARGGGLGGPLEDM